MKKVPVRICVATSSSGNWNAVGWQGGSDEDIRQNCLDILDSLDTKVSWVEAYVLLPEEETVAGTVTEGHQ